MNLLPLKNIESFYATQAAHGLLLGLKMLPSYMGMSYEDFYASMDKMNDNDQETLIREAAVFVKLEKDELLSICQFATDPNGIPYTEVNLKSLDPQEIHEIVVAVVHQIFREHKIKLLSEKEKKNLKISQ